MMGKRKKAGDEGESCLKQKVETAEVFALRWRVV